MRQKKTCKFFLNSKQDEKYQFAGQNIQQFSLKNAPIRKAGKFVLLFELQILKV